MCGIAGIAVAGEVLPDAVLRRSLESMASSMTHRGPDDSGVFVDVSEHVTVGLCARRLAIQDCSPLGHQPMVSENSGNTATLNGELYNVRELRDALIGHGQVFHGHSDTEVVLRAYDQWGTACFSRFRGMFALAIWDARDASLVLARDRLGIKPLYYHQTHSRLTFASEVRAVLASGQVEPCLSVEGLASFLALGAVQEPMTIVDGLTALPCGSYGVWTRGGEFTVRPYWSLDRVFHENGAGIQNGEPTRTVRELLEEAVSLHLVSDVPLGVLLSGGIDSSALVGLITAATGTPPRTVSVVFPHQDFTEERFIDSVRNKFGTDHTDVRLDESMMLQQLPGALAAMDQPTGDGINTYIVSRAAREAGLTVVLSGLGGDELFAGYDTFSLIPALTRLGRWLPLPASRALANGVMFAGRGTDRARKLERWFRSPPTSLSSAYALKRELFPPDVRDAFIPGADEPHSVWRLPTVQGQGVGGLSHLELAVYMRNVLLRDSDVMSMAHGLELRVPLLDHELVEAVAAMPDKAKVTGRGPKPVLVDAVRDLLPDDVVGRSKMGFTLPFAHWMKGALRPSVEDALLDKEFGGQIAGFLEGGAVEETWARFLRGRAHWSRPWSLYALKCWGERHLPA